MTTFQNRQISKLQLTDYSYDNKIFYKTNNFDFGNRTPLHSHDFYEIHLVTKGRFLHLINGNENILEAGHIQIIKPLDVHLLEGIAEETSTLVNFAFSKETYNQYLKDLNMKLLSTTPLIHLEPYQLKMQTFRLNLLNTGNISIPQCSLAILMDYLFLASVTQENEQSENTVPYWLKKTLNKMENLDNLTKGLEQFVKLSGKSHEHVSRTMKSCFGLTVTQWINSHRLNIAHRLILDSDMPILDIAYETGFDSESYFYRLYKKEFATTPNKERKSMVSQPSTINKGGAL